MNPQLDGIETIEGTYPFDLRSSIKTIRLNRFFWNLRLADQRDLFQGDEAEAMRQAGLTAQEQALVRARDWLGLVRYGVNFFVLEKFARVVRMSNLEVYARMRGESFEDFLKTRRVPEAR
jgi:protocatechuate 4,5-dioxygenase alpha chain